MNEQKKGLLQPLEFKHQLLSYFRYWCLLVNEFLFLFR